MKDCHSFQVFFFFLLDWFSLDIYWIIMQVFCLEHRSFKSHECPKSDIKSRKVIVCEVCSDSIETTGEFGEGEKTMLEKHKKSGDCDPRKQKKPSCPVKRCKEKLTFSNTATCKTCNLKVCLKHRFPADHSCKKDSLLGKNAAADAAVGKGRWNDKFLFALASRNGKGCSKCDRGSSSSSPSVKAYWNPESSAEFSFGLYVLCSPSSYWCYKASGSPHMISPVTCYFSIQIPFNIQAMRKLKLMQNIRNYQWQMRL